MSYKKGMFIAAEVDKKYLEIEENVVLRTIAFNRNPGINNE